MCLSICGKYHYDDVCMSKRHMQATSSLHPVIYISVKVSSNCVSRLVTHLSLNSYPHYTNRHSYTCYPPIALMTMTREDWKNSPADKVHFVLDLSIKLCADTSCIRATPHMWPTQLLLLQIVCTSHCTMGYKQCVFHPNLCILNHCNDCGQKRTNVCALHISSVYIGAAEYTRLFTELHTDLLDVLCAFPSCRPPLERLIGQLPQ